MPIRHSLFAFLALSISAFAADNWPEFRGPHGDGHADAKNLPLKWSDTENVRWKTAIHDKGWSSPVVWGNQVWVTTATENGDKFYAVALDRETGKVIHDLLLFEMKLEPKRDKKGPPSIQAPYEEWAFYNSYASPTPVIEDGHVYVHFGISGTACLNTATGKPIWKRTDLKCNHHRGPGSSPILFGDMLYLTFDGFDVQYVIALDKKTGDTVWKQDRSFHAPTTNGDAKKAYATPLIITVNDRALLVSPSANATAAYDAKTGEEVWKVIHGGMNASLRPVFGDGHVFTCSSDGGDQLVAVRPDGKGNVTKTHVDWTSKKGVPNRSSFLFVDDKLFMCNRGGVVSCLDAKTGKEINQGRLDAKKGEFWCSPIVADGKWYTFDDEGQGFVISADEKLTVLASNKLPAGTRSSPAAVGKSLFVRTGLNNGSHVYCLEEKAK
jgi:outer membrane protein assembly factor BamB